MKAPSTISPSVAAGLRGYVHGLDYVWRQQLREHLTRLANALPQQDWNTVINAAQLIREYFCTRPRGSAVFPASPEVIDYFQSYFYATHGPFKIWCESLNKNNRDEPDLRAVALALVREFRQCVEDPKSLPPSMQIMDVVYDLNSLAYSCAAVHPDMTASPALVPRVEKFLDYSRDCFRGSALVLANNANELVNLTDRWFKSDKFLPIYTALGVNPLLADVRERVEGLAKSRLVRDPSERVAAIRMAALSLAKCLEEFLADLRRQSSKENEHKAAQVKKEMRGGLNPQNFVAGWKLSLRKIFDDTTQAIQKREIVTAILGEHDGKTLRREINRTLKSLIADGYLKNGPGGICRSDRMWPKISKTKEF